MRRTLVALAVAIALLAAAPATFAQEDFEGLNPGGLPQLVERLPVTFVFIGFERNQVDHRRFQSELATTYEPIVRSRAWYGIDEPLGLHYDFDYRIVHAGDRYTDRFFDALSDLSEAAAPTLFQELYNVSGANLIDIEPDNNAFIDAPSVERWLRENPPPGVDTRRNTIFFVNWYGREDFKFHVYTKFNEPEPDTDYNFGELRESRKMSAWGGTAPDDLQDGYAGPAHRIWFYDVSAGPEFWAGSYDVIDCDAPPEGQDCATTGFIDFDLPETEYRLPPIWEYATDGYRQPSELSSDLGKVARYVGLDLLIASSPLYPPYLTPEALPRRVHLDLNTFEGIPGVSATESLQTPSLLRQKTSALLHTSVTHGSEAAPYDGKAAQCYVEGILAFFFVIDPFGPNCFAPAYPSYPAITNLFLHGAVVRDDFVDGPRQNRYNAMAYSYAVDDDQPAFLLGFADDNWIDGTQSFVFNVVSPSFVEAGYGLTTTEIHEYGHHWGLSHPHDGYDPAVGDFGPVGDFYFVWLGDYSNSMMSYIDLNWDFSQFDRDNYDRFAAAAYMLNANRIAAQVLATGAGVASGLGAADVHCVRAKDRLAAHDYTRMVTHAKRCYNLVRAAAQAAGVEVEASANGWTLIDDAPPPNGSTKLQHLYSIDSDFGLGLEKRMQR